MARNKLKGGVSIVDISPGPGVQLVGYPYITRENTGIHDPLYATCLYLDDGIEKVAIINADLVGFEKPFVKKLREKISRRTGIPPSNIMLSGSHTHSGPRIEVNLPENDFKRGWKAETGYLETLAVKLVEVAADACNKANYVRIGCGEGHAGAKQGIGGNRRVPEGPADPSVGVVGLKDMEDRWVACWIKYSLHPTLLQADNTLVSADFPCYIRKYLEKTKPGSVVMFAQGATGDQSSRYFRTAQTFGEAERFGHVIGKEADRVLDLLPMTEYAQLGARVGTVTPVWREIPLSTEVEAKIAACWKQMRELEENDAPYVEKQTCYLDRFGAEHTLLYAQLRDQGKKHPREEYEVPFEIQVIRIGDFCIVGIQGEMFVDFTLKIAKMSPFEHTFVVTLANGLTPGYIVTQEAAEEGAFEAGTSMLKPETGDRIVEAALKLCNELNPG